MNKTSVTQKDIKSIAGYFLDNLIPNKDTATIVALSGNLGVGKTTFTQEIGKILKVKSKINSPTFVIMKRYPLKNSSFKNLFHLDAYRISNLKELENIKWKEIISEKENLVFVEWPENIESRIPKKHNKISISHRKDEKRDFNIKFS